MKGQKTVSDDNRKVYRDFSERTVALSLFLNDVDHKTASKDALVDNLNDCEKLINDYEYIILTDKEADERAFEYIESSLWAFTAGFILDHVDCPCTSRGEILDSIRKIQEQFEGANSAIFAMIGGDDGIDSFVEDAITGIPDSK